MLFDISLSSVGQPPVVTVPEVTVRSVAPISAVFALVVFRVKRTVNSPKEAGVSYHYPWASLSFPPEHATLSLNVVLVSTFGSLSERRNNNNVPTAPCWIGRKNETSREFTCVALLYVIEARESERERELIPVKMGIKIGKTQLKSKKKKRYIKIFIFGACRRSTHKC